MLVALFLMATANLSFLHRLLDDYPAGLQHILFTGSVAALFTLATMWLLMLFCFGRGTRWVLALVLVLASVLAYFMDHYGVVVDQVMLVNLLQTDWREASDLYSLKLLTHVAITGLLPAWLLLRKPVHIERFKTEAISRLFSLATVSLLILACVLPFTASYASFAREHKEVRYYVNPGYFAYSVIKLASTSMESAKSATLTRTASDARHVGTHDKHELIIMVVGETARADHFALNGYPRNTNPRLIKQQVVSLKRVSSCGTSTAISVPCMFSALSRAGFQSGEQAARHENVLDVLKRTGVDVLWRDNNSDSKGVATRVKYEDFRHANTNPVCDPECRDIGMLAGLPAHIEQHQDQDMLIVLHQMGSHGPAYYKRYPADFEQFKPACQSSNLADCSSEEIVNAYDNTLLYTDYFLAEVIDLLKQYDGRFETAMLYVSDHGESLGEHGVYLHGAPYLFAPTAQTHVPAVVWMGSSFDYSSSQFKPLENIALSHDDLTCSLLIGYEIDSSLCRDRLAVFSQYLNRYTAMALTGTSSKAVQQQ
ncbi:phosphoethanolamine--lipid A transferase [Pseudomethylobacillus aquaticus]|uniref:Phosphoethanolamine--lipid A transferase n=2 Tax=Pseudomethylobacillus aquaticus TaxID=2676064 RepID=A0A3N0V3F0_9PROT|nr:phosphoethanolamine--lipid A transferase [Pseudomethylobacillus aquaticus]